MPKQTLKKHLPRAKTSGVTLVEILVCIALFSTAIVAIYMGTSDTERQITKGMQADVEAAIANMKIAEVNPFDPAVDTAYDAPATFTTGKQSYTLPGGQIIYWTRTVTSADTSGDVKQVNVYLYKTSAAATPYRKFRKDLILERQSYMLADTTTAIPNFYKDPTGTVWAKLVNSTNSTISSGVTHRPGPDSTGNGGFAPVAQSTNTATGVPFNQMWKYGHLSHASSPTRLAYTFPATQNQTYTIKLGLCECLGGTATQRSMRVFINNALADNSAIDAVVLAGADRAIVRQYRATAIDLGSGVFGLKVEMDRNSSTLRPLLLNIQIERNTSQ